jgi:hypothetical protein
LTQEIICGIIKPVSQTPAAHRLRLKLPSGAEFEAEGSPEFVSLERKEFLGTNPREIRQQPKPAAQAPETPPAPQPAASTGQATARPLEPNWNELIEIHGPNIQLRAKLKGGGTEKEACLVLLAASQRVLRLPKPTAAQLARWMRLSGYPIQRVDRVIQDTLENGDILASGSRRGRRYELSSPGLAKAFNIALHLGATVRAPRHARDQIIPGQIELSI